MELKFQVQAKIRKPVGEVFDAVYNPRKLNAFFTTGGASGPLDEGKTVKWYFTDVPGSFPVEVKKVVKDRKIILEWEAAEGGYRTKTEMTFAPLDRSSTLVRISESGWRESQKALDDSYKNCEGWTQMLCCLKAYLEHGINLREFYF